MKTRMSPFYTEGNKEAYLGMISPTLLVWGISKVQRLPGEIYKKWVRYRSLLFLIFFG